MIGSFWNLCRACPSMPVDKLHSEYRSTYRWHEYRSGAGVAGGLGGGPGAAAAAGDSQEQQGDGGVVRRAPLPQQPRAPSIEPAMPRRKKYPGLAYKTNEIFEAAAAGLPSGHVQGQAYTLDRARSMERTKYLASRGERRSKSEGPRAAQPQPPRNWTDTVEEKVTSPSIAVKGGAAGLPSGAGTEYRNKFGWPRDEELMVGGSAVESQPRKSVSMGQLKAAQASARRRQPEGGETELEPLMNHADDDGVAPAPDYRKKQACEDFLGQGESTQQRRVAKKEAGDATDGGGQPQVHTTANGTVPNGAPPQMVASEGDSWYKEVLDLRKRAGEYKYRGWGTELAPEHLTELYNKQMDLWYQVSRRSSLSALSLASTNHRIISKDEKDNENKNRTSPSKKPKSFRSAPYQSMNAKLTSADQTDSRRNQRRKLQGHSFDNASVSEGKASTRPSARTSPRKQLNLVIGGRGASVEPASADARSEYRSPKRRPRSADPKALQTQAAEDRRRPSKPSGLALNSSKKFRPADPRDSVKPTCSSLSSSPKRKNLRAKIGITIDDDAIPLRSSSAFREPRLLDDSPVVKSPPEPTRVKSPEQMNMRSPDPVNWTVPLDTGKTFTVTQNVNNADDLRQRPGSESRGAWGADSPHSLSLSAPPADLPAVHQPKPDVPKSVEISQRTVNFSKQHAKTPTSPPNLTPIDELKVLDVSKPFLNGNGPSTSSEPSPVNNENRVLSEQKENFEMAAIMKDPETNFKPTEATQKSHGGVDTSVVSGSNLQASVAAEVLEKARTRFDNFWGKKDGANDSV